MRFLAQLSVLILVLIQASQTSTLYESYLLHPTSGDTVYAGRSFTVTWFVDPTFSNLNLFILGGGYNLEVADSIPNSGSYIWNVPTSFASSTAYYMVLNRADWNTNDQIFPFKMVSLTDQLTSQRYLKL
jgi:hypothetical protein